MSSKFKPAITPKKPPPWCKPGLYPIPPGLTDGYPNFLIASATWKDFAPPVEPNESHAFRIALTYPPATYYGESGTASPSLYLHMNEIGDSKTWNLYLWLRYPGEPDEDFEWLNVPQDAPDIFILRPPDEVTIPDVDFRRLSIIDR